MFHRRFDYAAFSLFTIQQLARPFTIEKKAENVWYVFSEGVAVGRVTFDGALYHVDPVVFIPATKETESAV